MWSINSKSPEDTIRLGKRLAKFLKPDSLLILSGRIGSGKTTLVKGIAEGLDIDKDRINSPTFVLIREYYGGRLPLFHFDFYRLDKPPQLASLGIDDYFDRGGVSAMEWPEKAKNLLPRECLCVNIVFVSKSRRRFKISARGKKYRLMMEEAGEFLQ